MKYNTLSFQGVALCLGMAASGCGPMADGTSDGYYNDTLQAVTEVGDDFASVVEAGEIVDSDAATEASLLTIPSRWKGQGWTTLNPITGSANPADNSLVVYVSNSKGNTIEDGSIANPFKTLAKAKAKLRPGYPDWIRLRKGDIFYEAYGKITGKNGAWMSGRSPAARHVITGYDDPSAPRPGAPRPRIAPPPGTTAFLGNANSPLSYVAIVGIHMEPNNRSTQNGAAGIHITNSGIDELRIRLNGKRAVFCGHSGVGKTTLLRALLNEQSIGKIGDVNTQTGKGRHTTSSAILLRGSNNSQWIDTPGVREFAMVGVDADDLHAYFKEFTSIACANKYCKHLGEDGCAAVQLPRYASYRRIYQSLIEDY